MKNLRPGAAVVALSVLLLLIVAPLAIHAEQQRSNDTQQLALKIKGWDCDG